MYGQEQSQNRTVGPRKATAAQRNKHTSRQLRRSIHPMHTAGLNMPGLSGPETSQLSAPASREPRESSGETCKVVLWAPPAHQLAPG